MPLACEVAICPAALEIFGGNAVSQCNSHGGTMGTYQIDLQEIHPIIEAAVGDPS